MYVECVYCLDQSDRADRNKIVLGRVGDVIFANDMGDKAQIVLDQTRSCGTVSLLLF